jgi:hypothetical protein
LRFWCYARSTEDKFNDDKNDEKLTIRVFGFIYGALADSLFVYLPAFSEFDVVTEEIPMKNNANRWSSLKRWVGAGGIFMAVFFAAGTLNPGALRADGHDDDRDGNRHDFVQTNLVSDISGLAKITDSQLVNPWGVSHLATSPFWTSNQGTNTATLYAVTNGTNVNKVPINPPSGVVLIPLTSGGPQGPTGQVSNSNAASFPVKNGGDGGFARFIFANLNGTISAWDGGPTAFVQATTAGAVYTGLTINGAQTRLYAVNAVSGGIDVFDSTFSPLSLGSGAFVDPFLPAGAYALQCAEPSPATFT